MDEVSHNSNATGKTYCVPDWQSDIAHIHLSLEKIQMESDEKIGRLEVDVSNIKHSLQHTTRNTDSASSRLQDVEDVIVSNQGHLENLLKDLRHQLNLVQEDVAAFSTKLQHVECLDTIQSSVLAFRDFTEKSLDRHKEILQCSSMIYDKLSQGVADTRGDISEMVDGICQDISTFQESTLHQLTALQDSIDQWPACDHHHRPTLLSELGPHTDLHWESRDCSPTANVVNDLLLQPLSWTARTARIAWRMWTDRQVYAMVGLLVSVIVIFMIYYIMNTWFAAEDQIKELMASTTGMEKSHMWKYCRDTWGTTRSNSL